MFSGKTNPMCVATTVLSLAVILMITMIQDCDGYLAACNGSTAAECQVFVEEEEEFMMDTEEHMQILETINGGDPVTSAALNRNNPACKNNCPGRYTGGGRGCTFEQRCH